ncbi:MAG TPA: metal ABC transporter permease [Nitrospiria bacterium]|jgi:ABC-type Mn2+/Zn2+ transport system permease subunit
MPEWISYGFIQRALLSSVLVGCLCSIIGVFVILKGFSFIGAGTAHSAFAGVTLAYLLGINPMGLAILFGVGAVWVIGFLEQKGKMKLDVSTGIFYTSTMALAILFIGMMKGYNAEVYGYLFGSILSVSQTDIWIMSFVTFLILFIIFLFYKEFHFIAFDQEMADASGIPARTLSYLLLTLIALTIVISLKSVGAVLVFALVIIPAATAYQLTHTMKTMMICSVLAGTSSSVGGVFLSYWFDLPSGATIVLLATGFFFLSILFSPKRKMYQKT